MGAYFEGSIHRLAGTYPQVEGGVYPTPGWSGRTKGGRTASQFCEWNLINLTCKCVILRLVEGAGLESAEMPETGL